MGLRSLYLFDYLSAGIDFRRQNLTSIDVRFCRLKSVPALKGLKRVEMQLENSIFDIFC